MSLNSTSGDAAAESYFSVTEADAYFTNRNNSAWTGTTPAKEAAARLGTQYLENTFRARWVGLTATQAQALSWPRVDGSRGGQGRSFGYGYTFPLYDINGWAIDAATVPAQIKYAAMEAALLAIGGTTLEPTLARGGQIKSLAEQVGPISETTVWQDGAPVRDVYTVIDGYLRGLVTSNNNVRLVRA